MNSIHLFIKLKSNKMKANNNFLGQQETPINSLIKVLKLKKNLHYNKQNKIYLPSLHIQIKHHKFIKVIPIFHIKLIPLSKGQNLVELNTLK